MRVAGASASCSGAEARAIVAARQPGGAAIRVSAQAFAVSAAQITVATAQIEISAPSTSIFHRQPQRGCAGPPIFTTQTPRVAVGARAKPQRGLGWRLGILGPCLRVITE